MLRKQDPEVINGVLHTVMLLRLHKEDLGKDLFPQIMDVIIDYIAEGLTRPEEIRQVFDNLNKPAIKPKTTPKKYPQYKSLKSAQS